MNLFGNDGGNTIGGSANDDLIYGFDPNGPQAQVSTINATRVGLGFTIPVFATAPLHDPDRLFIVEKGGLIKVLDLATGQVAATPFLDVSDEVTTDSESGLLGLTFDPNYAQNGFFYVDLINLNGDTEVRRYQVSGNPDVANAASSSLVITVDQPDGFFNHKGGWLAFGPDGDLYMSLGDGRGGNDPFNNAQDINLLLGKILRLDVHNDAFPGDPDRNYAIPAGNPFIGGPGADEIYALGLRNPWRPSFDRATGDFYIADVGQDHWEEIDIGAAGANYGWRVYEGPDTFGGGQPSAGILTFPIYAYDHTVGVSITGGYAYRGSSEGLQGQYFFADFGGQGKMWTLHFENGSWVAQERTSQLVFDSGSLLFPTSFGEDGLGNLYATDLNGDVFRLTPQVNSADLGDDLSGGGGNDKIYAGSGNDRLSGDAGDDWLMGMNGGDVLIGGPGNNFLDGGAGTDFAVYSSAPAGVIVNLLTGSTYNGHGGTDTLTGIEGVLGSPFNDTIIGDLNDNTMAGGAGNDSYFVDNTNDSVLENPGEGSDTVYSSIHLTLAVNVEFLVLQGNGDLQGYGNALSNAIYGTAGNNILSGDAGGDAMYGRAGNDFYYVDNIGDLVIENPGEGNDTVYATANFMLPANVETLILQGTADLQAYGNAAANVVFGNSGNNLVDGGGGADTLQGFAGNDIFVFRAGQANGDSVVDFTGNGAAPGDSLQFVGFGAGATFTQIDSAHWQVNYNGGSSHETITFNNLAAVHSSDFAFV